MRLSRWLVVLALIPVLTRADDVIALLGSDVSRFVLVASPRADTIEEAQFFATRLQSSGLAVSAVVVNRCTPTFGEPPSKRPRAAAQAALHDNLVELRATADAERAHAAHLLTCDALANDVHTTFVPTLSGDVHTMEALTTIRFLLFPPTR